MDRDGRATWQGLLEHSVLIRDCSGWPRLAGCLRVTVGRPAENDAFLSALAEVLA
jgi:histidinol-phosphate aminotransferase